MAVNIDKVWEAVLVPPIPLTRLGEGVRACVHCLAVLLLSRLGSLEDATQPSPRPGSGSVELLGHWSQGHPHPWLNPPCSNNGWGHHAAPREPVLTLNVYHPTESPASSALIVPIVLVGKRKLRAEV